MTGVQTCALPIYGYSTVDTDYGYTTKVIIDGIEETILNSEKLNKLIDSHKESELFVSGCYSNQGDFYNRFNHIVLLKADLDVMLDRIYKRNSHSYGKNEIERIEIIDSFTNVLPLLEKSSTLIIDTSHVETTDITQKLIDLIK